jgi:hypothetical protein
MMKVLCAKAVRKNSRFFVGSITADPVANVCVMNVPRISYSPPVRFTSLAIDPGAARSKSHSARSRRLWSQQSVLLPVRSTCTGRIKRRVLTTNKKLSRVLTMVTLTMVILTGLTMTTLTGLRFVRGTSLTGMSSIGYASLALLISKTPSKNLDYDLI